jgi:putative spermidine/putrescine transport system substrate-binding protein
VPVLCRVLRILILTMASLAAFAPAHSMAAESLRVLAWPGYADEDFVKRFEERTGARVEVTFVGTDDALWDRISEPGQRPFDVFAVNTAELQRYIDAGLVRAIDAAAIPNVKRQLPQFQARDRIPGLLRDGRLFAVPYAYAEMGLIYDRRTVASPPDSISVLWDPRYRGRVLAYDGGTHNFSLAAMRLGKPSPFRYLAGDWTAAIEHLIALRRNVLTFYSLPEESVELFRDNGVSILFANYGTQQLQLLRAAGADVGYVIPREGALAWLDCWAVTTRAKSPALAMKWISFMLEPEASYALTARHGLNNTLQAPADEGRKSGNLVWLEPVEDSARRAELWHRIISGERAVGLK